MTLQVEAEGRMQRLRYTPSGRFQPNPLLTVTEPQFPHWVNVYSRHLLPSGPAELQELVRDYIRKRSGL